MSSDSDITTFLERMAGEPAIPPMDPGPVVRRARRRLARTAVAGALGVAVAVAVTLGSVSFLRSSPNVPADPMPLPPILREGELLTVARNGWIKALDPATGEERKIVLPGCDFQTEDCNTFLYRYELSADGQWLAYDLWTCTVSFPCDPQAGLWVVNALGDRHHLSYLCDPPGGCLDEVWAWSPHGATLAAYGGEDGGDLVTVDPRTGQATSIVEPGIHISALAWSPDGKRLAYTTNSVQVIELATGRTTTLPGIVGHVFSMAWSPDGTRIVLDDGMGDGRIVVRDIAGSEPRVLVYLDRDQPPSNPSWSPDGTRIAYFSSPREGRDTGFELWVIGADGSEATRVFDVPLDCCATDEFPVWSPDGNRIAVFGFFGSPRRPGWMVVNADGTGSPEPIEELEVQSWRSGA